MSQLNPCSINKSKGSKADAMGCQKKIAKKIIVAGADYLLGVKYTKPQFFIDSSPLTWDMYLSIIFTEN